MTTGTIDLGELPHGAEPEVDARWSIRAIRERLRHRPTRRARRLVGGVAVAALVLASAAAGAPTEPVLAHHFTVGATGYLTDGQTLYVLDGDPADPATAVILTAYRLADAGVRWRAVVPGAAGFWPLAEEGTLLVLAGDERLHTIAFDAGSGRRRWSRGGYPLIVHDRVVFGRRTAAPGPDGAPFEQTLTAVDPVTGAPEWAIAATWWSNTTGSPESPYLLASGPDGLTSYHLATGEPLATATLARPPTRSLKLAGGLALDIWQQGGTLDITAYEAATLTRRWTRTGVPVPAGDRAGDLPVWAEACGYLICLYGPMRPRALDPATGQTVWSADWLPALPAGDGAGYGVVDPVAGSLDGHLVLTYPAVTGEQRQWLADAATGARVLDLGGWHLPGTAGWAPATVPPEPVLTWRSDDGPSWLGRLRPDLSGVTPLGAIDTALDAMCAPRLPYVLCAAQPPAAGSPVRDVEVWRFQGEAALP